MTEKQFENGHCTVCKKSCSVYCDECNVWICEDHTATVQTTGGGAVIHLCPDCIKRVEPGKTVGGVLITPSMISK